MPDVPEPVFQNLPTPSFSSALESDFRIAMVNIFRISAYDEPYRQTPVNGEWLIVSWDAARRILTVSDADTFSPDNVPTVVPTMLTARNSFVAILANQSAAAFDFLAVRTRMKGLETEGTFFPTDGFFTLFHEQGRLSLKGSGRFSVVFGTQDGVSAVLDSPEDDLQARQVSWHFAATHIV